MLASEREKKEKKTWPLIPFRHKKQDSRNGIREIFAEADS